MRLLSGLTSPRSTLALGVESWIASLRACRASPTPLLEGDSGTPTTARSGRTSAASSRSASRPSCSSRTSRPSSSTTDLFGIGYTPWVSSTRRRCWSPRTNAEASSDGVGSLFSLPAPTTRDWKDGDAQTNMNVPENGLLPRVVASMPAPRASIQEQYTTRPRPSEANGHGACLAGMVSTLPVPTSQDAAGSGAAGYSIESGRSSGTTLTDAVCGAVSAGRRGRLNPLLSEWIQGLPVGWSDCEPLGMSALHLWWRRQRSFISRLNLD